MKFFISIALSLVSLTAFGFGNLPNMRDIDHRPQPSYKASPKKSVIECTTLRDTQEFRLNNNEYKIKNLLRLVATTKIGKELLDQLTPLLATGQVKISDLSDNVRHNRKIPPTTAALYDFTMDTPTIFIDFDDELGLVAQFFVHEATHALDQQIRLDYAQALKTSKEYKELYARLGLKNNPHKELTDEETKIISKAYDHKKKERDQHSYRAERLAFNIQGAFTKEFLAPNDCTQSYINEHIELNRLKLFTEVPDQFIFRAYQINPKNIEKPKEATMADVFDFDLSAF